MRRFPILGRVADQTLRFASLVSPQAARQAGLRLLDLGRIAEAETLLQAAAERFPRHGGLAARRAFAAEVSGRGEEAIARWRTACALAPNRVASWRALAACARQRGDVRTAETAIAEALARRPRDPRVLLEAALVAEAAAKLDVAHGHWSSLVGRRRVQPRWRQGLATTLMALDRIEQAQAVLGAALRLHPDDPGLVFVEGQLALRGEAWDKAFDIFSRLAAARPDDEDARIHLERVSAIRRLVQAEAAEGPPQRLAPIHVARVEDEAVRTLLLRFEGIGADCEFGALQRRFGAEPLGLLRWNDVAYPSLVAALEARFAGMGEPDLTELVAGEIGELYLRDRRWDLGMHTFLFETETSRGTIFPKLCRRVAFLRDKFLADLASAEKVFVYKTEDVAFEEVATLHGLLGRFGPARLLHVRSAASAGVGDWPLAAPGEIATLAPGLFVGYISRISDLPNMPYEEWIGICRAVLVAASDTRTDRPSDAG